MNCRPGDLAVFIRSTNKEYKEGTIVRVMESTFPGDLYHSTSGETFLLQMREQDAPVWRCQTPRTVRCVSGRLSDRLIEFEEAAMRDRDLRPLRDSDGEDETLQWAQGVSL